MKKKLFSVLLALVLVLRFSLVTAVPVGAKGPVGETVTINWLEDAVRYNPDGSVKNSWTNDGPYSGDLVAIGKTYRFATIQEYYNTELPDLEGKLIISGSGILSGHATYTWYGLPTRNIFHGRVTIDANAETMVGTYTQWKYVFGSRDDVLSYYPNAFPAAKQGAGWWVVSYTDYIAHQ